MTIGENVRAERKRLGLTQEALARRAGMSKSGVQMIEHGERTDLPYSSLKKLSAALGLTIGELVGEGQAALPLAEAPEAGRSREEAPDAISKASEPRPFAEEAEQRLSIVPEALEAWMRARVQRHDREATDRESPHFRTATAAVLWVSEIREEAAMWSEWALKWVPRIIPPAEGSLDVGAWRNAFRVMGHLLSFHTVARKAEKRIEAMNDRPDELAQRRYEEIRHEAEESERRIEKLRAASSG